MNRNFDFFHYVIVLSHLNNKKTRQILFRRVYKYMFCKFWTYLSRLAWLQVTKMMMMMCHIYFHFHCFCATKIMKYFLMVQINRIVFHFRQFIFHFAYFRRRFTAGDVLFCRWMHFADKCLPCKLHRTWSIKKTGETGFLHANGVINPSFLFIFVGNKVMD